MDSPAFKFPNTPGMPLFPISPERINASQNAPASPSHSQFDLGTPIPFASPKHGRTNSDVQVMVARFNSLDIKDHAELRRKDEAALKRAQMGREEAESDLKRMREENRLLKRDLEEGRERERKVMKRLDVVMEDLHRSKETQTHAQSLYEREIRRARKEAFKSSSAMVKLQEELKATRNCLRVTNSDLELEKQRGGARDQETFNAQYQLVGVQEELNQALSRIKVVEEERDALKTNLKEEEVARIAAEGRIALPPASEEDDEFSSPKKLRAPMIPESKPSIEIHQLRDDLARQARKLELAEERVEFMKMECQFQCCSCRVAESRGLPFIHDSSAEKELARLRPEVSQKVAGSNTKLSSDEVMADTIAEIPSRPLTPQPRTSTRNMVEQAQKSSEFVCQTPLQRSPLDGTADDVDEESDEILDMDLENRTHVEQTSHEALVANEEPSAIENSEDAVAFEAPPTPATPFIRTVTTTITVPLADPFDFAANVTLTREEAIERIRQRRGRTRSVTDTPKKLTGINQAINTPRRDISAPEIRTGKTPKTAPRTFHV